MPFLSTAQQRFLFKFFPTMAKETKDFKNLPEKKGNK